MDKDIVADLLNMSNQHANEEAELLEDAASEIDLLRDEKTDLHNQLTAALQEKVNALSELNHLRETITLAAAPLGITGEPGEVVKALVGEMGRLREWKDSVLSAIKWTPEFTAMDWAGDKEGWGFCFELVKYLSRTKGNAEKETESLRAQLLTAREQGRREGWIQGVRDAENEAAGCHSLTSAITAIKWLALSPKGEVCEWKQTGAFWGAGISTWAGACGHHITINISGKPDGVCKCGKTISIKDETVCEWKYAGSCTFNTDCGGEFVIEMDMPTECLECGKPIHIKEG